MRGVLKPYSSRGRALLVVAAPVEARPICSAMGVDPAQAEAPWRLVELSDRLDLVVSGVGKSAAAGATAKLLDPSRHAIVISLGVAGSLPGSGLSIGDAVAARQSVFADEGFQTPEGFTDVASAGFPPGPEGGMGATGSDELVAALGPLVDATGNIATVSTCSGTDALADEVARRTGALAEAMEGGAVGVTVARIDPSVLFAELRVISNTTGDRGRQAWDLDGATRRLGELARDL